MTRILHCHWREFWLHDTEVHLTYIGFGIIFTLRQFLETGTWDRCLISVSFNAWDSQVSAYTSFNFSFTLPVTNVEFKVSDIDELVVHPDYFESRDLKHGNPYDIALLKTKQVHSYRCHKKSMKIFMILLIMIMSQK